jgi:hypothetical protein
VHGIAPGVVGEVVGLGRRAARRRQAGAERRDGVELDDLRQDRMAVDGGTDCRANGLGADRLGAQLSRAAPEAGAMLTAGQQNKIRHIARRPPYRSS